MNKKLELDAVLEDMVKREGSDLHLKVGEPPMYRIFGKLTRSRFPIVDDESINRMIYGILTEERRERFENESELDLSYEILDFARFRMSVFRQSGHIGAVFRYIPLEIKSIDDWELPPVLKRLALLRGGLILVTGPTGSGKSTTLSAMILHINESVRRHIIIIEDPIEFLHKDIKSTIEQLELGIDTLSFADALKSVVRQSPDLIMVGEVRDLDTLREALNAAETGHLVLATLHTTDASQTVDRIVDMHPPGEIHKARLQLSNTLHAVISESLLRRLEGKGLVAAFDILICTDAVRTCIREGKTHQIPSIIQTGTKFGMQLLDDNLKELYLNGIVAYDEALSKSSNPDDFEKSVSKPAFASLKERVKDGAG